MFMRVLLMVEWDFVGCTWDISCVVMQRDSVGVTVCMFFYGMKIHHILGLNGV